MAVFLVVAELRGFRAAGKRLGLTPSAISHAIRTLEERVGAPLFVRTTRSVRLTEAGARLASHAKPAMEMLKDGLDAAAGLGAEVSGRLRINAPRACLPLLVNRLLPDFLEAYPKLQLELVGEDNLIDIVKDGFDAGIRLGNFVQQDMVSLWLTPPEPYVVVGTPDFFARHGRPVKPEDLKEFRCIELRRNDDAVARWQFLVDTEPVDVQVGGALIANDVDTCLRAALKGSGLFRLPRSIAMNYVWAGLLESVLDKFSTGIPGLALYYPSRSQSLPKLRAFIDFATPRMRRDFQRDDYNISPSALRERAISPGKIPT
ncbi:hypothetical protein BSL82_18420 (plasmid) [Tardibacter chloracetimidivorans]|uniref:HTH lysR-type domain-containing protein n=2 Tax=Tardibacter chloracetimidivorans TaxID=1921510 RepID=A0A1L4A0L3_9SPHN|nr:hypothetical protein BSL82_18420 [Tardibacter chloracetimidivorans]